MATIEQLQTIDLTDLSRSLDRYQCSLKKSDTKNMQAAKTDIAAILSLLPSGSGIDAGMTLNYDESKPDRLVFDFEFHHMIDGAYTGWTQHKLIIVPSFVYGFVMRITGPDKNQVKNYLYQVFEPTFKF
jgi:hypothetical protein